MSAPHERQGTRLAPGSLRFSFNGRALTARSGDTVASALLANDIRLVGRSVKTRRRRGILTAGPEEPNALVTVGSGREVIPNIPATQLIVTEGMQVRSQNTWPSPGFDVASVLQLGGGLFSAGFYYKTFFWPSWHAYEPLIRRLAGLGAAPRASNLPSPAVEHFACDTLIAGGGPAGLLAARTAARAGAHVVLCEREPFLGGELEFEPATLEGLPAGQWIGGMIGELRRLKVRLLTDTTVVSNDGDRYVAHSEPGGLPGRNSVYHIRARRFVVAMGAVERPMVFAANDLPGTLLLGAAERYLTRYGVRVGLNAVIGANHNRVYPAALRLSAAGMRIRMIVDSRGEASISDAATRDFREKLIRSGVECLTAHSIVAAKGRTEVRGAEIRAIAGSDPGRTVDCDCILTSGGWTPVLHAADQGGGQKSYSDSLGAFVPDNQPPDRVCIGAARGSFELAALCNEVVRTFARDPESAEAVSVSGGDPTPQWLPFWMPEAARSREKLEFVDFQNDVTVADLRVAVEEGYTDIEHAKRFTALGFGTDQGRLGGTTGAAILAHLQERPLREVGASRLRAPYQPVTMRSVAELRSGNRLRATRVTPLHDWHVEHGAVMESTGLWKRPRCYDPKGAGLAEAALKEAKRVREHGGIADASTLGKIEICGPDAASFLDYVYLTKASTIAVGRSRYAVNLREDGMVLDDGLILRLSSDRFRLTTSTSHAEHMLSHFEFWRATAWANAAVAITDVSEAWSVIAIAGPKSREALARSVDAESAMKVAALRHMEFASVTCRGIAMDILRATFSGELGFEIHCPPDAALSVWSGLIGDGWQPYGLDAMDTLRIEKGYLTHAEISGQVTPYDLGLHSQLARDGDFIGRELLSRPAFHEPDRPRLVGLRTRDKGARLNGGAQIVLASRRSESRGYVTSSAFSPALGEWVALGLVSRTIAEGQEVVASDPLRGTQTVVRVSPCVHFDPSGTRMRS